MEVLKDEAPMTSKDANQIVKLLGERTWAAHNANFDWITLQKQFHRAKVGASPAARRLQALPPLDTEQMAQNILEWKPGPGKTLNALAQTMGFGGHSAGQLHSAEADARLAGIVYYHLSQRVLNSLD